MHRVPNKTSAQNTGIAGASAYLGVLTETLLLFEETLEVQQIARQALCSVLSEAVSETLKGLAIFRPKHP